MLLHTFIFFILAIVVCIGAGSTLWSVLARSLVPATHSLAAPSSGELGIAGLFAIGISAIFLNFFVAISLSLALILVTICLIAGLVYLVRAPKPGLFKLLVFIAVVALFSVWGTKFLLRVDAGIYHIQAISWMKDEPVVIGLANIQHRFGFNSLSLSALAVFWLPFYEIKGVLLANYLAAILTSIVFIDHLLNIPRNRYSNLTISMSEVFAGFTLAGFAAVPVLLLTNSTSTDVAANAYTLLSVLIFLRGFESSNEKPPEVATHHMMLWIVGLFAVLAKLSAIVPALLALVYMLYHREALGIATIKRTIFFLVFTTCLWLLRNFLLSGCLIFPAGLTCMNTDVIPWGVGSDSADNARMVVERWARAPGPGFIENAASVDWFSSWLQTPNRGLRAIKIATCISAASAIVLSYVLILFFLRKKTAAIRVTEKENTLVVIILAGLATLTGFIFGFVTAPDPRFWWGPFTTLLLLPMSAIAFMFIRQGISIGFRSVFAALIMAAYFIGTFVLNRGISWKAMNQPMATFHTVIPEIETKQVSANGFILNMPVENDMCWLAPKPCSGEDPKGLREGHFGPYLVYVRESESNENFNRVLD